MAKSGLEEYKERLEELDGERVEVEVIHRIFYSEDKPTATPTESFQEIVERAIREASMYSL